MCWSSRTTWRGVVRFERERPEPSAIRGRSPKPVIVRRTTAAPARVVPPAPNSSPSALISVSALKLSDGRLVRRAISAIVAEERSASGSAAGGVRPARAAPPITTSRRLSARAKARAANSGGRLLPVRAPGAGAAAVEGQRAERPDLVRGPVALGRRAAQGVPGRLVADHAARDLAQASCRARARPRARPPGARRSWGRRRRAGRGCRSARRPGRRRRRRARSWSGGRRRRRASARRRSCRASRRTPGCGRCRRATA